MGVNRTIIDETVLFIGVQVIVGIRMHHQVVMDPHRLADLVLFNTILKELSLFLLHCFLRQRLGILVDNGEKFLVELRNATLTNVEGFVSDAPDLTLTIDRADLELTMAGEKALDVQLTDGTAKLDGDPTMLGVLAQAMVDFDPFFEVLPGTRDPHHVEPHSDAFEAVTGLPAIE